MNIPFVRSLEMSIAWRYEKFDNFDQYLHNSNSFDNPNPDEDFGGTPRVSLRYQPIADVTLRASWGQSFLSPNTFQLFQPAAQNFPAVFDPFINPDSGAANGTYQPAGGVFQSGNLFLQPEKTDAYSAGVVWTPKFLPGFTMTADWYQVYTKDLILGAADFAQVLLTLNAQSGGALFTTDGCNNGQPGVLRDPATTLVICENVGPVNAAKRLVQGIDVTAVYEIPTERFGKFTLSGGYNHFFTWKAEPVAGPGQTVNFLGNYIATLPLSPGAIPWNKAFLRGEWEWRNFDFVATGNYVGDYRDDSNLTAPIANVAFVGVRTVPSYMTLDMQLSYEFVKPAAEPAPTVKDAKDSKNVMQTAAETASIWQRMLWGTKLTVGVNDAFDRQPPTVGANLFSPNDNYDTSTYSIRNRYYYLSLSKKF